ncbi:MAG: hypothetical protein ACLUD2_04015 [Clostridium sp.]
MHLDYDGNAAAQKSVTSYRGYCTADSAYHCPADKLITNKTAITVKGTTNDKTSSPVTVTVKLNSGAATAVTVESDGSFSKDLTLVVGTNTTHCSCQRCSRKDHDCHPYRDRRSDRSGYQEHHHQSESSRLWQDLYH